MSDEELLKRICENCIKGNGFCIKDLPYIGLCAENDREELLEVLAERKGIIK